MSRHRLLTIACLGLAAVSVAHAQNRSASRRPVIAVMSFTNATIKDHDMYDPFTVGVAGMLLTEMRGNQSIELVERHRLREVMDEIKLNRTTSVNAATAVKVGRILGAQHMIFGVFIIDARGNLRIDARAVNVETSIIEHVESVMDTEDNLLHAVQELGQKLNAGLKLPGNAPPPGHASAKPGQFLADLKFARAIAEEERNNPEKAAQLYREYLADSPADYAPAQRREAENRIRVITAGRS